MINRLRIAGAEIPDFTGLVCFGCKPKCLRYVGRIKKVAFLRAVAHYRERLPFQFLFEEYTEHRAIDSGSPYPRPVSIEDANRIDRQAIYFVPMKTRLFSHVFTQRVGIARLDRMILACRRGSKAVARRRCGINQFLHVHVTSALQHMGCSLNVCGHIFKRVFNGGNNIADPCKMENVARLCKQLVARMQVANVSAFERKIRIACKMSDIAFAAAHQIVYRSHSVAMVQEIVNHVTADKSRAAGDNGNGFFRHAALSTFMRLTLK